MRSPLNPYDPNDAGVPFSMVEPATKVLLRSAPSRGAYLKIAPGSISNDKLHAVNLSTGAVREIHINEIVDIAEPAT